MGDPPDEGQHVTPPSGDERGWARLRAWINSHTKPSPTPKRDKPVYHPQTRTWSDGRETPRDPSSPKGVPSEPPADPNETGLDTEARLDADARSSARGMRVIKESERRARETEMGWHTPDGGFLFKRSYLDGLSGPKPTPPWWQDRGYWERDDDGNLLEPPRWTWLPGKAPPPGFDGAQPTPDAEIQPETIGPEPPAPDPAPTVRQTFPRAWIYGAGIPLAGLALGAIAFMHDRQALTLYICGWATLAVLCGLGLILQWAKSHEKAQGRKHQGWKIARASTAILTVIVAMSAVIISIRTLSPAFASHGKAGDTVSGGRVETTVSLPTLMGFYKGRTEVEADRLFEPYRGKWRSVRNAVVEQIRHDAMTDGTELHLWIPRGTEEADSVYAQFGPTWNNRILILRQGEKITAFCKLDSAASLVVFMNECELK